jgi:hypothetical protein
MAKVQQIAGAKLYIGGQMSTKTKYIASDFTGQAWTEIGGWATAGDLGAEQEVVSQSLIADNTTSYAKGTVTYPTMTNTFVPDRDDSGQQQFNAAAASCLPYAFKIDWSAGCGKDSAVTFTYVEDADLVVNWPANGLSNGDPVTFETTGTLPAPLVAGTTYYVVSVATGTFEVSLTVGGASIVGTSAGSGTHRAEAPIAGETDLFVGLALLGTKTGGDSSAMRMVNFPVQPIAQAVQV